MTIILRKPLIPIALATFIAILAYPFELTVVPEWEFRLLDVSGNPLPAMRLRQIWHHPLIQANGNQESATSDINGYTRLPERTTRASIFRRIITEVRDWQTAKDEHQAYSYITIDSVDYFINNGLYGVYRKGKSLPRYVTVWRTARLQPLSSEEGGV